MKTKLGHTTVLKAFNRRNAGKGTSKKQKEKHKTEEPGDMENKVGTQETQKTQKTQKTG